MSGPAGRTAARVLVLQHDPTDPLLRLGPWLEEAGAGLEVIRPFAGDEVPAVATGFDAVVSLGGEMGAYDDAVAPWLPATRNLLARSVEDMTPILGICLGSQLLAVAAGGTVAKAPYGPEIGAYLIAKRDAADRDPLFADMPMTPDVVHYHYDVVVDLPADAVLLYSSDPYPNQVWRLGESAWGLQFHIEPSAADVRGWAGIEGLPARGRLGPVLDAADAMMAEVWRSFAARFVTYAAAWAARLAHGSSLAGQRLPLRSGRA